MLQVRLQSKWRARTKMYMVSGRDQFLTADDMKQRAYWLDGGDYLRYDFDEYLEMLLQADYKDARKSGRGTAQFYRASPAGAFVFSSCYKDRFEVEK